MVTIPADPPDINAAAAAAGLAISDLDVSYGVVPINPTRRLFAVMARADAPKDATLGPFANPRIATLE